MVEIREWSHWYWKFPSCFPQKIQNAIKWHRKGPSCVKISQWWFDVILWWIEMFTGLGELPYHFNRDLKISLEFPSGFSFHSQPKFPCGFPPQPQSPGIPTKSAKFCPLGSGIIATGIWQWPYGPGFVSSGILPAVFCPSLLTIGLMCHWHFVPGIMLNISMRL